MKSAFRKLLPMVFLALLSFAPLSAHAAAPTGPRDGMFDCLGDLDWGCRIISFLFESTDNKITYWKDGAQQVENADEFSVLRALRVMMGFFSNALLIVASIKLLYELIQMTAESAQTGQIGGKDTNKLWAPIRLVIAIGLLVPLDTGLNSAQYIVMQMAKWGSGLASQGWLAFVSNLSENQSLATPSPPRIRQLAANTLKTYVCVALMNYYAKETGKDAEKVTCKPEKDGNVVQHTCGNQVYEDVCGTIKFKTPISVVGLDTKHGDAQISLQLADFNNQAYMISLGELTDYAADIVKNRFSPPGYDNPYPNSGDFDTIVQAYQTRINDKVADPSITLTAMKNITDEIKNAAGQLGWTSAGSWFLSITRAQGQIVTGAMAIPDATGPNESLLASAYSNSAGPDYAMFSVWFDEATRPQDKSLSPSAGGSSLAVSNEEVKTESSLFEDFLSALKKGGQVPADYFFNVLDHAAAYVGLWTKDPRKAFGDLGETHNPFGEIAELGYKKIRLALNYLGYAFLTSAGAGIGNAISKGSAVRAGAGRIIGMFAGGIGGGLAAITAILIMIATLFLLAGILLAFIVPLFPYTRFFFAILTWVGSLIEAMICVPFMALAFLTPKGEGFSGPNTRNAFFLIFQTFLRPILSTFGLILAMIMFYVAAKFLNSSFYEATSGIANFDGGGMRFIQKLVYSVVYVGMIYVAANISFKMIEHVPKHALKWMGGSVNEESYDDHSNLMQIAGAVGGQQLISNFTSLPEKIGGIVTQPAASVAEKISGKRDADTNFKRHNEGINTRLLAAGGVQKPRTKLTDEGAVSIPDNANSASASEINNAEGEWRLAGMETDAAQQAVDTQQAEVNRLESLLPTGSATQDQVDRANTVLLIKNVALGTKQAEENRRKLILEDLKKGRNS